LVLLPLALALLLPLRSRECRLPLGAASMRALLAGAAAASRLLLPVALARGEVTGDLSAVPAVPAAPAVARGEVTGDWTELRVLALALLLRP
jgi:hypothetical protein